MTERISLKYLCISLLWVSVVCLGCPAEPPETPISQTTTPPVSKVVKPVEPPPLPLEVAPGFSLPKVPAFTPFCPKERFETCQQRCTQGEVGQCVALGLAKRSYHDAEAAAMSTSLLRQACNANAIEACYHLGETYRTGHGVDKNPALALTLHERACNAHYAASCFSMALLLGEDTKTEPLKARRALGQAAHACRLGVTRACSYTARLLSEDTKSIPKNLKLAVPYHDLACTGGRRKDCMLLAFLLDEGKDGAPQDQAKAAQLYDQACKEEDQLFACARLGKMLGLGLGVPEDMERGLTLLWDACNTATPMCGQGKEVFQKSCDAGNYATCNDLGLLYLYAKGVDKDPIKARALFELACKQNTPAGCTSLGLCYANGEGGPKNERTAVELFKRACEEGHLKSCSNLGLMHYHGRGVRKNPRRARALWKKHCSEGHEDSCTLQKADKSGTL